MSDDLASLKSTLRSLVVSSPTRVDLRTLLRDYRSLIGEPLPLNRFGYRDPLTFLKERCSDCFLFQGMASNPFLTLIVPETLKHIDKFVQKQKSTHLTKLKGKRTSIPEHVSHMLRKDNLIVQTYKNKTVETNVDGRTSTTSITTNSRQSQPASTKDKSDNESGGSRSSGTPRRRRPTSPDAVSDAASSQDNHSSAHTTSSQNSSKKAQLEELKDEIHTIIKESEKGVWCKELMMRYQDRYGRVPELTRFGFTSIVGLVETLKERVRVTRVATGGDWLLQDAGAPESPPPPLPPPVPAPHPTRPRPRRATADVEDALPGVPYAPDVFPADCLQFEESVPMADLTALRPPLNLEVIVGEVYSPSHFWLIRLGPEHNIAMEDLMDEMTQYFEKGEGVSRYLSTAALRVGQYCAALYARDWHRAIIVDLLDGEDHVKVRHVDYGTVDTVPAATLRPLPRRWARLPQQAMRARQAGVRPAAAGRRWPPAASEYFLRLVRDRPLIASLVALDLDEATLEVFLVDTSQEEDEDLARDLIRAGYADARPDSALRANDCYLYPVFSAIESGATPNYAEIQRYLHDGVTLDYVPAYRRHVPAALPPLEPVLAPAPASSSPPLPSPSPPPALTRVPLLRPVSPSPPPAACTSEPSLLTASAPAAARTPAPPSPRPMQSASSCQLPAPPRLPVRPPAIPPTAYGMPRPPQGILPPRPPQGILPPLPPQGILPPHTMIPPMPPPPFGAIPPYGYDADWAMYEQLNAAAHWYKMAAMRRAHLAAAAAPLPPPPTLFPPHPSFPSRPPPGF